MFRSLLPLLLVATAVGLFFVFTNAQYLEFKTLLAQRNEYASALGQYNTLEQRRVALVAQKDAVLPANSERLQKIIPDNVDNIRLFLDMQGIAARFRMGVANIRVGDSPASAANSPTSSIGPSDSRSGTITLSFSTTASYENLISFLKEIERSLRIVEIKSIDFKIGTVPNSYQVSIAINTFWLNSAEAVVINQ